MLTFLSHSMNDTEARVLSMKEIILEYLFYTFFLCKKKWNPKVMYRDDNFVYLYYKREKMNNLKNKIEAHVME